MMSRFNTIAVRGGYNLEDALRYNSLVVPIHQTAVYPFKSSEYAEKLFAQEIEGFTYGRIDNPTSMAFEKRVAALERGEAALATSSGMAAIFMAVHHLANAGDEIVASHKVYGGTHQLFDVTFPKMGVNVKWIIEPNEISQWEEAVTSKTKLLHIETPSNPNLHISDIQMISDFARSKNIPMIVDNTIATPVLSRPLEIGADIVIHSATKFISGNATSISGVIVGKQEFINLVRGEGYRNVGPAISPMNAWLCLLGLETLSLRMKYHSENAVTVARFLEEHPSVRHVNYPGLENHPQNLIAKKQMQGGFSSMLSFDLDGNRKETQDFIDQLKLAVHCTHLGCSQSVVTHPATTTHQQLDEEERFKDGISDSTIRMSIGLEDVEDILEDLDFALSNFKKMQKGEIHEI